MTLRCEARPYREGGLRGTGRGGVSSCQHGPNEPPVAVRLAVTTERTRGAGAVVTLAVAASAAAYLGLSERADGSSFLG